MYISGLISRNFAELAEAVPIAATRFGVKLREYLLSISGVNSKKRLRRSNTKNLSVFFSIMFKGTTYSLCFRSIPMALLRSY